LEFEPQAEWFRSKGEKIAVSIQRFISSDGQSPPKPPTSLPTKGIADKPKEISWAISILKLLQIDWLSPVQTVEYFSVPL
jgi:hypothetical protein